MSGELFKKLELARYVLDIARTQIAEDESVEGKHKEYCIRTARKITKCK